MSTYDEIINDSRTSAPQDYLKGPFSVFIKDMSYYKYGSADYLKSKLLSEEEIEERYNSINDKDALVIWQILSEKFIIKHILDLNLILITRYQVISEQFIRTYCMPLFLSPDKRYFSKLLFNILRHQALSEEFINEYLDIIIESKLVHVLCRYQELSEAVISHLLDIGKGKPYYDILCRYITHYQELSVELINQYPILIQNPNCKRNLYNHQALPKSFYDENRLPICNASITPEADWKYMITKSGKFEIHDNYFYAYKIVRADDYSVYNYNYRFEKESDYYTFSDYSYESESFGFESSTFRGMLLYKLQCFNNSPKFKVIKVKIFYKDLTYFDIFNNKYEDAIIRSNKIYIVDSVPVDSDFVKKMYLRLKGEKLGEDFNMMIIPDHATHRLPNRNYENFYDDTDCLLKVYEVNPGMFEF